MKLILLTLLVGSLSANPPDTLTLEYCYSRVEDYYPLAEKAMLQQKITNLNVQIANTGYFPQLELGGRARYQSEIPRFPDGQPAGFPVLSKDQYEISAEVIQPLYNGGATGVRKKLEAARGRQERLSVEVQMQEVRGQVDDIFYGILLAKQQRRIVELLVENLRSRLETISAQVEQGVQLPGQQYVLQAELAKARQDSVETASNIETGYSVLGELIGEAIPPGTPLKYEEQANSLPVQATPGRVELKLFDSNIMTLEYQKQLETSKRYPTVSLFGTAAYGRPGYNFFDDDLHGYYMAGIQIRWNFWDWNNAAKKDRAYSYRQQQAEQDRQAFNRQLDMALKRIEDRMQSLKERIESDREIISLRKRVVEEKESQLRNGTITSTEYVTELNSALQAEYRLMLHRIQLARARTEYRTALGLNGMNE